MINGIDIGEHVMIKILKVLEVGNISTIDDLKSILEKELRRKRDHNNARKKKYLKDMSPEDKKLYQAKNSLYQIETADRISEMGKARKFLRREEKLQHRREWNAEYWQRCGKELKEQRKLLRATGTIVPIKAIREELEKKESEIIGGK